MAYNKNQECSQRAIRRNKRGRPEKKDRHTPANALQDRSTKKHPTKPKNHKKIAELKALRVQRISDAKDYSEKEQEIECARLEKRAFRQYLDDALALEIYCHTNIAESERDLFMRTHGPAETFSIYADGWPY